MVMEAMEVDGRRLHFGWCAKVWRYPTLDCNEDEMQEEEKDEVRSVLLGIIYNSTLQQIICGQRVVTSRQRLHRHAGSSRSKP